ncbi:tyrosine-protein phosphatase [Peribacillus alkalitolerans]|uniref:tyrosine-protein phosphatase n=1 Tax=Peribacillus alkalitolerans TaxID=1550385 RepID=UPI0013D62BA0|nr:tyrosine-protein phosphatase [Peribacillus alkalitolerans]
MEEYQSPFKRLYNFRDIGGKRTSEGKKLKEGILYRSGDLSKLNKQDMKTMETFGFRLIVDVRGEIERKTYPNKLVKNTCLQTITVPIQHDSQEFNNKKEFFKYLKGETNLDFEEFMKDFYRTISFERTDQIRDVISLLADKANYPILLHCTGGKDRTGFISAMVQLVAGVPMELVTQDYLLSNELNKIRMKKLERIIRWGTLFQVPTERLKPIFEVREEYLIEIIDILIEKYGSIEEYLISGCNIDQDTVNKLKHNILE